MINNKIILCKELNSIMPGQKDARPVQVEHTACGFQSLKIPNCSSN